MSESYVPLPIQALGPPTPVKNPETQLVERAQEGDRGAFEELYRIHVGRIYGLCLRMLGDRQRAQERTQDVFVRVWQKLESFRGTSAFGSWVHRLAVNVVLGEERRRKRKFSLFQSRDPKGLEPIAPVIRASDGATIDLERAILALPPKARLVFILFDIQGHRHGEISELTGMAEGTSKAHLHQARERLKERLKS